MTDDELLAHLLKDRAEAAEAALVAAQKRVGELEAAGDSLNALITQTQERLTAWLCPDGAHDERECMNELLEMFDGPRQREIQSAWRKATGAK